MPRILGSETFTLENVSQVAATIVTENFYPPPVRIRFASHRAIDGVVETGPTASRAELIIGPIKGGVAAATEIGAWAIMMTKLTGSWPLSPFVNDDTRFFIGQRIQWRGHKTDPRVWCS